MGNGFDINNFSSMISNLGKAAASMQNNKNNIDTKAELNTYVSGWDAIKASAEKQGAQAADIASLEGDMKSELANLLGAEFGKTAGVKQSANEAMFSDEEISLENMMSLLEPEDGLDMDKLKEYNKQPLASTLDEAIDGILELSEAGFSDDLIQVMIDETPGAIRHISNSIKDGSAERIGNFTQKLDEYAPTQKDANILGWIQYDAMS